MIAQWYRNKKKNRKNKRNRNITTSFEIFFRMRTNDELACNVLAGRYIRIGEFRNGFRLQFYAKVHFNEMLRTNYLTESVSAISITSGPTVSIIYYIVIVGSRMRSNQCPVAHSGFLVVFNYSAFFSQC